MKKLIIVGASGLALTTTLAPSGAMAERHHSAVIAVYGDAPYGTSNADTSQTLATPAFIDSINADPEVSTVIHVGDIHSGKQYCTESYDRSVAAMWTSFQDPLVYTPGDNEWADCHKVKEGGGVWNGTDITYVKSGGVPVDYASGNPIANLNLIRSLFFPNAGRTLGQHSRKVISQARAYDHHHPSDAQFVENVMFQNQDIVFVTVNIPGGSNNDNDIWYGTPSMSDAQRTEIQQRTDADLRWIDKAFRYAREESAKAVVIIEQADMWDLDGNVASHLSEYEPLVASIARHTAAFRRPVLLFNGDSHVYRSDNPLAAADPLNALHPGYDVSNFHRVVVHGSTAPLEWLKLTIDTDAHHPASDTTFGPFSWERMIQS